MRNYADNLKHDLKLNSSSSHANYFSAWRYTTKDDNEYLESECHAGLKNAPQTQEVSQTRIVEMAGNEKRAKKRKRRRQPRLSICEVSQVAVQKGIKSRLELVSLANQQKKEGRTDLAEFYRQPRLEGSRKGSTGRMGNGRGSS